MTSALFATMRAAAPYSGLSFAPAGIGDFTLISPARLFNNKFERALAIFNEINAWHGK